MIKTVCFTGHRNLRNDSQIISDFLYNILDRLISEKGVTDYYSGGAVGFDTIAAFCVIKLKEKYPQVKLHLVLPCSFSTQTVNWSSEQIENYNLIIGLADSIEYISKQYYDGCMKARNARLIEYATDYCISYWNDNDNRSGTGQTVRMA